jgi:nucleoside-diphosphate-sugar epimerase
MSLFSVYDLAKLHDGEEITEIAFEEQPESRGAYSLRKACRGCCPVTPADSTTMDDSASFAHRRSEHDLFAPVGAKVGNTLVCSGRPRKRLLLVHVEDVAAAVLRLLQNKHTQGQVYTISDRPTTVREYVDTCIRQSRSQNIRVLYVPYFVTRLGGWMATLVQKLTHLGPRINRRRLLSFYRDVGVSSALLQQHTGWQPAGALLECLRREAEEAGTSSPVSINHQDPVG